MENSILEGVPSGTASTHEQASSAKNSSSYTASNIQVLKGLEAVRKRPGMYIGSTGPEGLHHLVYEVVDNSIDEAMAGYCDTIHVTIEKDNIIRVEDNGRGIPTEPHPLEKISSLEVVLTQLHAGGKFDNNTYKVSGGLHGVGVSVVNALSEWLEVTVHRDPSIFYQEYKKGVPVAPVSTVGETGRTGTAVRFKFDPSIIDATEYSYRVLTERFRELAFLNKGIKISIADERGEERKFTEFHFEGGIRSFIQHLNESKKTVHPDPVYFEGERDNVKVEISLQYNDRYDEVLFTFVNNINTREGGTHLAGFRSGLTRVMNEQLKKSKLSKKFGESLAGDDLREGLTAVISIKIPNPQFEGQTKMKLGNPGVQGIVASLMYEKLNNFFDEYPAVIEAILDKAILAAKARFAARDARMRIRKTSEGVSLPGKLADCAEKDPAKCEIFIVEGDSAGGSAKQGRDRQSQAILPLWGKMLNVEKAREEKVLGNEKLQPVIASLGAGLGAHFDVSKARYHKVIIMADADVDGSHIRTLLLTFFFRYMRDLIEEGYVYFAMPPLYKITIGKKFFYAFDEEARKQILEENTKDGADISKIPIQRYKGLGEMNPDQLWETTMNPDTRSLTQVTLEDAVEADQVFSMLMGEEVEPRKKFIEENAIYVSNLDV